MQKKIEQNYSKKVDEGSKLIMGTGEFKDLFSKIGSSDTKKAIEKLFSMSDEELASSYKVENPK